MTITATLLNYFHICPRKAWLHQQGLRMEQESEAAAVGKVIDRGSYSREKKAIDLQAELPGGIRLAGKVDWVNLRQGVLHETKKGKACEEAHLWQLRFYLWLLRLCGVKGTDANSSGFTGMLNYPTLRKTIAVTLEEKEARELNQQVRKLQTLLAMDLPPPTLMNRSFCRKCAFEELCFG